MPAMPPAPVRSVPATPNQAAWWRAAQQGGTGSAGSLHWRLELDGEVELALLRRAWEGLVQRHEALRTGLAWRDGTLWQEVRPAAAAHLALAAWAESDDELCERLGRELHERRFDLGRPPLARAMLVRAGARRELHVCGHRAVLDEACWPLLLQDLSDRYGALSERRQPALAAGPVPFRVFSEEERAALQSGAWQAAVEHLRSRLEGAAPARLTPGAAAGARSELGVAVLRANLSAEAAAAVRSLAGACRATPLAVFLAALRALLGRAGAGSPMLLGMVAANRRTARDRAIVGPLANSVAVAGPVADADSARALVARALASCAEAQRYGHVPFPVVAAALEADRHRPGVSPPVILLERRGTTGTPAIGSVPARPRPGAGSGAGGDVQLAVRQTSSGWAIEVEYRTALFDRRTVAALVADLDRALARMGGDPDVPLGALAVRTRASGAPPAAGAPPGSSPGAQAASRPAVRDSLVVLRLGVRPHVHLFHPGGGGTAVYQPLAAALPPGWTVTASEDTHRSDTIEDLAERHLADLSRLGAPDVLGGWSMGGLLAYEALRQLKRGRATGAPALLLVDSPPPIGYGPEPDRAHTVPEFAESLWRTLWLRRFRLLDVDAGHDEEAAMCALAASLWRAGEDVRPDWLLARLDEYRRHRRAVLRYTSPDRVDVPAVLVAAELDEPHLDEWRRRLSPRAAVVHLAGGHFDVLRAPLVAEVARLLVSLT